MRRGTFQLMKSVNKSLILNKIRISEPISRAQMAKETNLTPPTVSSIVKELIGQGLVKESELGESNGGRKPTMLLINNTAFYVIGVEVGPKTVKCILADLSGAIYERRTSEITKPVTNQQLIRIIIENIREILHTIKEQSDKVIGIGVAMHGVVDIETGTLLFSSMLNLKNVPIKQELEKEFDFPIKIENDARAMALGESWFGLDGDSGITVTVNIGYGVGAGIVHDGKLYHGESDIAGEFGHMTIDIQGEVCECGNQGCLQAFAGREGIIRRAKEKLRDKEKANEWTVEKIFDLAQDGDENAMEVLQETGKYIGIGLTNLIHIINPRKIILGGETMKNEDFLLTSVHQTIKEHVITPEARETKVTLTRLGEDVILLGAVALLLVELFNPV